MMTRAVRAVIQGQTRDDDRRHGTMDPTPSSGAPPRPADEPREGERAPGPDWRSVMEKAAFGLAAAAAALFPLGVLAAIATGDIYWAVNGLFAGWPASLLALLVVIVVFAPTRNPLASVGGGRGAGAADPGPSPGRRRARPLARAAVLLSAGSLIVLTPLIPPVAAGVAT